LFFKYLLFAVVVVAVAVVGVVVVVVAAAVVSKNVFVVEPTRNGLTKKLCLCIIEEL